MQQIPKWIDADPMQTTLQEKEREKGTSMYQSPLTVIINDKNNQKNS